MRLLPKKTESKVKDKDLTPIICTSREYSAFQEAPFPRSTLTFPDGPTVPAELPAGDAGAETREGSGMTFSF
jgi:hypothetical protein